MKIKPQAVLGFPECEKGARALASLLKVPFGLVDVHTFPDGESRIRVPLTAKRAILYRPLDHPNTKIFEVIQAASALRDNGAREMVFVCPYLPYMRQDKVFHEGEALSQDVFAKVISPWFDALLTVEPHLHRSKTLKSVFPGLKGRVVSGGLAMAEYYQKKRVDKNTLVLGPDEEAWHTARPFAEKLELDWAVAAKKRRGDREVEVKVKTPDLKGRPVLIVDDVISTGMTVLEAAGAALRAGAVSVEVAAVHALFGKKTEQDFKRAGISWVVSCDGVPHPSNRISLAPAIAGALRE